jgi:hypothetical protein
LILVRDSVGRTGNHTSGKIPLWLTNIRYMGFNN